MAPSKEEKKFLLELIDVYRSLPALWQIKSKEYSDRQKKDSAYETLLIKYREYYKEGTKDELKKKLNALRTNFRNELKKIFFVLLLRLRHTSARASAVAPSIAVHRLNIAQ